LNTPVGRLVDLLFKDPATIDLGTGVGFPGDWSARVDQILALPGDLRRQGLEAISFRLGSLFAIDPTWTERQVLPCSEDLGDDGDAFWQGVFWGARKSLSRTLFLRLKRGLCMRATAPRLHGEDSNVVAGLLLAGWGAETNADSSERLITDIEFREILIHSDGELREDVIRYLWNWSTESGRWRELVLPFLKSVWPKQRALSTSRISALLTYLALFSRDLMPSVIEAISTRLIPVRDASLNTLFLSMNTKHHPARLYPKATLDLLWRILAEDPRQWPYKIEEFIEILAQAPELVADPRLSELRRRRER
jgi:hypothetical protein